MLVNNYDASQRDVREAQDEIGKALVALDPKCSPAASILTRGEPLPVLQVP